jgi:hypothetical protein
MAGAPEFYLERQILDQQLLDRNCRRIGKVDGLVMLIPDDGPPLITHMTAGGTVLGDRISGPLGAALKWTARRWGAQRGAPMRIPWSTVKDVGVDIEVDIDAGDSPALHWERLIRRHIVERIPWA